MVDRGATGRKRLAERTVRLSISLPLEDYAELCAEAERMRVSLAWVVRRAVSAHVAANRAAPPDRDLKDPTA